MDTGNRSFGHLSYVQLSQRMYNNSDSTELCHYLLPGSSYRNVAVVPIYINQVFVFRSLELDLVLSGSVSW